MHVGINESWNGDHPTGVKLLRPLQPIPPTLIDNRNPITEDTDISRIDLTRVDVEQIATTDHQIELSIPTRRLNQCLSPHGSSFGYLFDAIASGLICFAFGCTDAAVWRYQS
jgi:hypothetical protein